MASVFTHRLYQPLSFAMVSMHDRGHSLGDGVYEYVLAWKKRLIDLDGHLDRLYRSLTEIDAGNYPPRHVLKLKLIDFCRQNSLENGGLYFQLTRGTKLREHYYEKDMVMNCSMMVQHYTLDKKEKAMSMGIKIKSMLDMRWQRCDIKVISLIANSMAKQSAKNHGFEEAMFHNQDGIVSEGGSSNLWLLGKDGILRTHLANNYILDGITRNMVKKVCDDQMIKYQEKPFSLDDIDTAKEMFLTSSSQLAIPIIQVDDKIIGNGKRGDVTKKIQKSILKALPLEPIVL